MLTAEGRSRRELAHCTAVSGLMSDVSGKVGPWLLECSRRLWPWRYFLRSSVGKRLVMVRPQAESCCKTEGRGEGVMDEQERRRGMRPRGLGSRPGNGGGREGLRRELREGGCGGHEGACGWKVSCGHRQDWKVLMRVRNSLLETLGRTPDWKRSVRPGFQ